MYILQYCIYMFYGEIGSQPVQEFVRIFRIAPIKFIGNKLTENQLPQDIMKAYKCKGKSYQYRHYTFVDIFNQDYEL